MPESRSIRIAQKKADLADRLAKLTANTGATPGPTQGMLARAEVEAFDAARNTLNTIGKVA